MNPILRISALTSVIILASTTLLPGQAGDAPAPPPQPAPMEPAPDPRPGELRVLPTLHLQDFTLGQALDFFRDYDAQFQFILLPAGAADRVLPPMKLRHVTAADVLQVLADVDLGGYVVSYELIELGGTSVYRVQVQTSHREARAVFGGGGGGFAPAAPEPPKTFVFSLPPESDVDNLFPVVDELAATVSGEGEKPDVKFHKESGILIVRGTESQVEPFRALAAHLRVLQQARTTQTMPPAGRTEPPEVKVETSGEPRTPATQPAHANP